jgi:hypothetical protein
VKRSRRGTPLHGLRQAFDEVRFGSERTLNLRESLPTRAEAVARAEAWLRQQQVQRPGAGEDASEVLIITGRGNQSEGGVSVVREAIINLLHTLKRKGVVTGHQEHTGGSFVVTLASVHALWNAPKRNRDRDDALPPPAPDPPSLDALDPETRSLLRNLAERSLDALGVRDRTAFMEGEMLRQFGAIAANIAPGPDRERRLRSAIRLAMDQYE